MSPENSVPLCTQEPQRWMTTAPDHEAKLVCRQCPIRPYCARDGWETPHVSGLWAGIVIPDSEEDSRGHTFALTQLKHVAELGGLTVRPKVRHYRRSEAQRLDSEARRVS